MAVRALTVVRLAAAWLGAALAATGAVLLVDTVAFPGIGPTAYALPDSSLIRTYATLSLGFTLVLGVVHLAILTLLKRTTAKSHGLSGALLGLLTAGVGEGFARATSLLTAFTLAGCAAALTFHRVYYRTLVDTPLSRVRTDR